MFLNSFQESKQDVILMEDVNGSDLEAFVIFAYTGEMLFTKSNALGLLVIADYLNEESIKKACIDFLEVYLGTNDAFRAYKFANAVECLSLKNAAKLRIQTNFGDCSQTIEYLDLDFEMLKDVINDVKFDNVEMQQVLFEGIMRWIMHDPKERRTHVNDLLRLINVAELSAGYLVNYLGNMADRSDDDYRIVKDMMSYYHSCSNIEQVRNLAKKATKVLILKGNSDGKLFFHSYDFMEKKWSSIQETPDDYENICYNGAVLNNQIYYFVCDYSTAFYLEIINPTNLRLTSLYSSNIFGYSAVCACDRFVYLCGGYNASYLSSNQILRYDHRTRCTETLTPMRFQRYGGAAIIFHGHLHVLGGCQFNDLSELNLAEKYDFATMNLTAFPPMIVPRAWHAVAVLNDKLYVCGGKSPSTNSVEVYDPAANSWQLVASMNKSRDRFLVVTHEGKLWAVGGDKEKTVEVYDPSKDQWQMDQEMSSGLQMQNPAGVLISASCSADEKLYSALYTTRT